jgi:hypothetical protein
MKRYYGYRTKVYGGTLNGHDVAVEFNKALLVLNRARLFVDAEEVDRESVFYGDKQLEATLPDGSGITVTIESGMMGELTRAQLRQPDGSWVDLEERQPLED